MSPWLLVIPLSLLILGVLRFASLLLPARSRHDDLIIDAPRDVKGYVPRMETQFASFSATESQVLKETPSDRSGL
jgi:hypothetical protein